MVVRVRYADWTMDSWGGVRFLDPATLEASLAELVEFGPKEFSLEAGESGRIQLAIQLPPAGPATR